MITSCLTEREKLHLRSYLKKGRSVIRPLKVTPITKFEGAARYAMKENFFSRSTYIKCDGKFGVKDYPLRGAPQTQLMQALLNERHQHRLITIGLRRQGNCLVDVML